MFSVAGAAVELAALAGGVVVAASAGLIYLRGYLIPRTPTLTKRYLPLWLLRLFGKGPESVRDDRGNVDVESFLQKAGVIEECPDRDDLCLAESFEAAWRDRIDAIRDGDSGDPVDPGIEDFVERGEVNGETDLDDVTFEERGGSYVVTLGGRRLATWESQPAYLADAAAAAELQRRSAGWRVLGFPDRTEVVGSLRLWLDRCPRCQGAVTMDQETVQSCCHERQVLAATCDDCGVRLFEATLPSGAIEAD